LTVYGASKYPQRFQQYIDRTLKFEVGNSKNGFVDNATELTIWGISARANPEVANKIRTQTLTREEAKAIYYRKYYRPIPYINQIDPRIGFILFDERVHGQNRNTVRMLQTCLNMYENANLVVDGIYGSRTGLALTKASIDTRDAFLEMYQTQIDELAAQKANAVKRILSKKGAYPRDYTSAFTQRYSSRLDYALAMV
jgi:lysozyme family protein